jgi:hypothetical protein
MTNTYTPLATVTLGGSDSEIVFASIPATYRDLIVVFAGTSTGTGDVVLSFNSDRTNTYPNVQMFGVGSGSGTSASFTRTGAFVSFASTTQNNFIAQIMDYSATDKHKTVLSRYNVSSSETSAQAGRWPNNNAITSLAVRQTTNAFATGSTLSLYGVIA